MRRKTWALAGAAVLVAVTATVGLIVMSNVKQVIPAAAQEPPANTVKVEKGKLSAMVSLDGTLTYRARSDGSPYSVFNQARGTYTKLPDDGDKVDCGDVLYRVDDNPTSADVATAQAAVDAAGRQLGDAQSTLAAAQAMAAKDVAAAQQSATNVQQALADANANLAAVQAQADAGTASDQVAVANAGQALAGAQRALADAQKTFQALPAVTKEQIATAKNNLWSQQINRDAVCGRNEGPACEAANAQVAAAETAVNQANAQAVQQTRQGQGLVDQAQTAVDQAQAGLKTAEAALQNDQAKLQGSLTAAQTQVNAAQSALKNAEAALASTQAKGEQAVVAARAQVNGAVSAQQTAKANYDKLVAPPTVVLLLCGTVPAYRDLHTGDVGQDVRQLNRNLHELGYDANAVVDIDPDDNDFTWMTEKALEVLQHDKGFDVTGELAIGDAVFLPESVRIAKVTGDLGGSAQPGAQVLYATSDTPEVQMDLDASQQGEVKAGDRAQITLPGNRSATGKVDRLGRVAQVPAGQNANASARQQVGAATIPAFVSLDDPEKARGLDRAPVRVEITTEGVENALSVPVTALVGKSGGGFAVEVVRAGGRRELVAVKLGLFDTAGGRVQVEGDLHEGDQVVVPSL